MISMTDSASNTTSSAPITAPAPKSSSNSATENKAGLYISAALGVLGFLTLEQALPINLVTSIFVC